MDTEQQRAILVGLCADSFTAEENSTDETLDELSLLLNTAGGTEAGRVLQNRKSPEPATFIGEGKLQEVAALCEAADASLVIFDSELSPSQLRNLESKLNAAVLDRSALILDIFAGRARSAEGKLQVELAQYEYLLPRLSGQGTALSRLGGGIGTRGPGETKLETDRRHVRNRIQSCKRALEDVRKRRELTRRQRKKNGVPVVSLAGYTNAGKSTLMNALCGESVSAVDRLFETLDPTARKLRAGEQNLVLTDTVGFIRKLPHHLIRAFRATLEELGDADLILHCIDASHPEREALERSSTAIIDRFRAAGTPCLRVFNKTDLPSSELAPAGSRDTVPVSARTGEGLPQLLAMIERMLSDESASMVDGE